MSIASEITRIAGLRDTIRSKLLDFGIITNDSANLSDCATAIDGISKVTPSIPATTITIDTAPTLNKSTGVITMSASKSASVVPTVSKGYTDGSGTAGTITAKVASTLQLSPTLAAKTYTPGTSNQTIAAQRWLTGAQTIKGDSNLVAANIKSGKSIFGVTGTGGKAIKYLTARGSTRRSDETLAFDYNYVTPTAEFKGTKKYKYTPIPVGGALPLAIFAYDDGHPGNSVWLQDIVTATDGTTYLAFRFSNFSLVQNTYVPFISGETTINVPGPYVTWTNLLVRYYVVSGIA